MDDALIRQLLSAPAGAVTARGTLPNSVGTPETGGTVSADAVAQASVELSSAENLTANIEELLRAVGDTAQSAPPSDELRTALTAAVDANPAAAQVESGESGQSDPVQELLRQAVTAIVENAVPFDSESSVSTLLKSFVTARADSAVLEALGRSAQLLRDNAIAPTAAALSKALLDALEKLPPAPDGQPAKPAPQRAADLPPPPVLLEPVPPPVSEALQRVTDRAELVAQSASKLITPQSALLHDAERPPSPDTLQELAQLLDRAVRDASHSTEQLQEQAAGWRERIVRADADAAVLQEVAKEAQRSLDAPEGSRETSPEVERALRSLSRELAEAIKFQQSAPAAASSPSPEHSELTRSAPALTSPSEVRIDAERVTGAADPRTAQLLHANTIESPQIERLLSLVNDGSQEEVLLHMVENLQQALAETTARDETSLRKFVGGVRESIQQMISSGAPALADRDELLAQLRAARDDVSQAASPDREGARFRNPQMVERYWGLLEQQLELLPSAEQSRRGESTVPAAARPVLEALDRLEQALDASHETAEALSRVLREVAQALQPGAARGSGAGDQLDFSQIRSIASLVVFGASLPNLADTLSPRLVRNLDAAKSVASVILGMPLQPPGTTAGYSAEDQTLDLFRQIGLLLPQLPPEELEILGALETWRDDFLMAADSGARRELAAALREQIDSGRPINDPAPPGDRALKPFSAPLRVFLRELDRKLFDVLTHAEPAESGSAPASSASGSAPQAARIPAASTVAPEIPSTPARGQLHPASNAAGLSLPPQLNSSGLPSSGGSALDIAAELVRVLELRGADRSAAEHRLTGAARSILQQLNGPSGGRDGDSAASLGRAANEIRDLLATAPPSELHRPEARIAAEAVAKFQQIVQGQEALERLNPVLKAMGEPVLVLFPMIAHGMLTNLEVLYRAPSENRQSEGDAASGDDAQREKGLGGGSLHADDLADDERSGGEFERIDFHVEMPNLGPVSVRLLRGPEEIRVAFRCESGEIVQALGAAMGGLERQLRTLGYRDVSTRATGVSEPLDGARSWLETLLPIRTRQA